MAHGVTVQPALAVRAALTSAPTDLQRLLLRLDLENQQVHDATLRVTNLVPKAYVRARALSLQVAI